jgi:anthraniloyl-CoA monooxygenase
MKATIIGAGPAGLSTAILLRSMLDADVRILEAAGKNEAPGFGIALLAFGINYLKMLELDRFAEFQAMCMPVDRITNAFASTAGANDLTTQTRLQETQYWGVRRAILLGFLSEGARLAGVNIEYGADVDTDRVRREADSADILIGADGAGSIVRKAFADEFALHVEPSTSRYAWLAVHGASSLFHFGYCFTPGHGLTRLTSYPHAADECTAIITHNEGMTGYFDRPELQAEDGSVSAAGIDLLNDMFSAGLDGRHIFGGSRWRRFRASHCAKAAFGKVALVGDAYASVFYETGWGTSAALQESRILAQALTRRDNIAEAVDLYSRKSIEISAGLVEATNRTMKEVDGHSARFEQLGPAKFLETYPA